MTEYLVISATIAAVFGLSSGEGGTSLLTHFAEAIGLGFARFLSALSLPV